MEEESTLDLLEFWEIIKKHLKLIIIVTLLCIILTGILSYFAIPKVYEARTSIIIGLDVSGTQNSKEKIKYDDVLMYTQMIKTYAEIAKQNVVAEKAIKKLGATIDLEIFKRGITVTPQPGTQIIILKFKSKSPEEAEKIANVFTCTYIEESRRLSPGGSIEIMDSARIPNKPIKPRPKLNMVIAFVLGLLVSLGIIFLKEYMDNTIKTEDDVERYLEIPVLGTIPKITEDLK